MTTVEWDGEEMEDDDREGSDQVENSPDYVVVPGSCCECGRGGPCIIRAPVTVATSQADMLRPVCRVCLGRMMATLDIWQRDLDILVMAKLRSDAPQFPGSPPVDEVEEEPRDAGQAEVGAGEGVGNPEAEAEEPWRPRRRAVVDVPIAEAVRREGKNYYCTECESQKFSEIYYVVYKDDATHWYCKSCVPDEVLKKLEEVEDA